MNKLTFNDLQNLVEAFKEIEYFKSDNEEMLITTKFVDAIKANSTYYKLWGDLSAFIGYKLNFKKLSDHITDYQIVDYLIKVKSNKGEVLEFNTKMSLMIGFNFGSNEKIY